MKQIRLTGREMTVLRAVDFSTGTPGDEALEITRLAPEDFVDVVNGLMEVGYMETDPYRDRISEADLNAVRIEVNPSYALEIREAMIRK